MRDIEENNSLLSFSFSLIFVSATNLDKPLGTPKGTKKLKNVMRFVSWEIKPIPVTPRIKANALFLTKEQPNATAVDIEIEDVAFNIFLITKKDKLENLTEITEDQSDC